MGIIVWVGKGVEKEKYMEIRGKTHVKDVEYGRYADIKALAQDKAAWRAA